MILPRYRKEYQRRRIITNIVLQCGWGIDACWTRAISDSIVIESRDTKDNNNIGGPSPPINHIFLI